jgi:hypothetical protein
MITGSVRSTRRTAAGNGIRSILARQKCELWARVSVLRRPGGMTVTHLVARDRRRTLRE